MSNQPVRPHHVALVLETNNLGSGRAEARVAASLHRLLTHLRRQTFAIESMRQVVVTHDGLSEPVCARLAETLGRAIVFVDVRDRGYYEAKNLGFEATDAEFVVFADSDCWPDPAWLAALVEPFELGHDVVAGRTTYRDDAIGRAATSIDFLYFHPGRGSEFTRNFYANNVAFRRQVFADRRFPCAPMYRGACQVLGTRLFDDRIAIAYAPRAHTIHRFPDRWREFLELRLRRGRDLRLLAPDLFTTYGHLPRPSAHRIGGMSILTARWACSAGHVLRTERGLGRRARSLSWMTGIAALDAAGVLWRDLEGDRDDALSYHGRTDAFSRRTAQNLTSWARGSRGDLRREH